MHLMVATPCYGGLVTQRYMQSICALLEYGRGAGVGVSVELLGYDSLVPRARNTLVATFLDRPEFTHLFFVDADIGFHPDAVERLVTVGEDVVAGIYPLKIVHYGPDVHKFAQAGERLETAQLRYVGLLEDEPALERRGGFATGTYAGTGFMLIRRSALERMAAAYPELAYSASHIAADPSRSRNQYAFFDTIIEPETREYLSEDYTFCHRWRAIGGKLWLDLESRLSHTGPREFNGDTTARFATAGLRTHQTA
jgi:hypothetical protein